MLKKNESTIHDEINADKNTTPPYPLTSTLAMDMVKRDIHVTMLEYARERKTAAKLSTISGNHQTRTALKKLSFNNRVTSRPDVHKSSPEIAH